MFAMPLLRPDAQLERTGTGIPEQKREHIFQVFTPADLSTTRKHGGTGLELAIWRQLASLVE
jgi:two-component system, sensor histidine kinase and response regulator